MKPMIGQNLIPGEKHFHWRGLDLNEYESLRTKHAFHHQLAMVALGLIVASTALLLPLRFSGLSGHLYTLIGVYYWIAGSMLGKKETRALERVQAQSGISVNI